jgi:membrane protease YdiL (CAAX protease family)
MLNIAIGKIKLKNDKISEINNSDVVSPQAAILITAATFILFLFGGVFLIILLDYKLVLVFGEILLIILPLIYLKLKDINIGNYIKSNVKIRFIIIGCLLGFLVFFYNIVVTTSLISVFGVSEAVEESNELIIEIGSTPDGFVLLVVALILAGICEEFTFRGFLQTSINRKYPFWISLLVSSFAFGILHFDPQLVYTLAAFMTGLLLGYLYKRWDSYVVPVAAHASMNLIVLAISVSLV